MKEKLITGFDNDIKNNKSVFLGILVISHLLLWVAFFIEHIPVNTIGQTGDGGEFPDYRNAKILGEVMRSYPGRSPNVRRRVGTPDSRSRYRSLVTPTGISQGSENLEYTRYLLGNGKELPCHKQLADIGITK